MTRVEYSVYVMLAKGALRREAPMFAQAVGFLCDSHRLTLELTDAQTSYVPTIEDVGECLEYLICFLDIDGEGRGVRECAGFSVFSKDSEMSGLNIGIRFQPLGGWPKIILELLIGPVDIEEVRELIQRSTE